MTVKAHCPKCGKDHEMDDKYAGFVEKFHGEVECPECKLKAEFGADFNIECMAPWVTTILLSKNK